MAKRYAFNDAGSLVRIGKLDPDKAEDDAVASALREIAANKHAAGDAEPLPKESTMQTDIIKSMGDRLTEIRKAQPNLTEGAAMLKLAESRNPDDQALWREYKGGVALPSSVEKSVKVKKTLKTMSARIDQIMVSDPTCRSRESAIAKVAVSRLPGDQELWRDYRIASQQAPDEALPHSDVAPVGKARDEVEFQRLCRALADAYPGHSDAKVRAWARQIVESAPPPPATRTTYIAPPNR